jgi:ectoine hydroxylase-related dioxygenase (phytanoyl-CoA dioxygenase family)
MKQELTAAQVHDFFEKGFFVIENFWSPDQVQQMRQAFERLYADAQKLKTTQMHKGSSFVLKDLGDRVAVARVVWAGAAEPILLKFSEDPRLIRIAAQLLGSSEMDQLINQAHFKMPGDGIGFPWHQDIQHRDKKPGDWKDVNGKGSYVQTLTTLDPMTKDNGPVYFVPSSQKMGRLDFSTPDYNSSTVVSAAHHDEDIQGFDPSTAVPGLAPAGGLIVFGPYTIHGSFPNVSGQPRFSLINGYAYPGANSRVYPGEGSGRRLKVT